MKLSRRAFLNRATAASVGFVVPIRLKPEATVPMGLKPHATADLSARAALGFPVPAWHWRGDSSVAAEKRDGDIFFARDSGRAWHRESPEKYPRPFFSPRLADRFEDLSRHFVFEYYPWYATSPWRHWNEADRQPPLDIASNYVPRLGPYDSRSAAVLEQHARWIKAVGAGAINVSWWGRDSDIDRLVPALMDVMADHDIHVTFHLEPYTDHHALDYARDIQYLVTEYGDRRGWDCFLLLADADGTLGPVFKSFRTILPSQVTDCHGVRTNVPDYAPDTVWREQTDRVRGIFASDFDRVTLLADSLDVNRTAAGGFDGIAIYDNFVEPNTWARHAADCSARNLLFSFNINPGFDAVALRHVDPDSCYRPPDFEPGPARYDWSQPADREQAVQAAGARIADSLGTTVALQTQPQLTNAKRGFFLTYINSFNEWHEGHQFEPMKDRAALTAGELAVGYHNPVKGGYRLDTVGGLIRQLLD